MLQAVGDQRGKRGLCGMLQEYLRLDCLSSNGEYAYFSQAYSMLALPLFIALYVSVAHIALLVVRRLRPRWKLFQRPLREPSLNVSPPLGSGDTQLMACT